MSSSYKPYYRFLSYLLVFVLVFNIIGLPVANAAVKPETPQKQQQKPNIGELPNKPPKERMELTSKRTEYSERYLNPDGSFTEEIYLEANFYKDPTDKKWKKIDNHLHASQTKSGKYENTENAIKTFFSQQAGLEEIVSVEKDDKKIGLVPVQANKVPGTVKNNTITYKDIYEHTDILYQVNGSKVKEDIVLQQYTGKNTFSFEIKLQGL